MTTIALDDKTVAALTKEKELVAMTDSAGTVIGFFAPVKQEYAEQYAEGAARAFSVWGSEGMPKHLTTPAEVIAYLEERESRR